MRLINCRTLRLEEFFDNDIPPYSILSHTWGAQEVTLRDFRTRSRAFLKGRAGYNKIEACCTQTLKYGGLGYCWIDTCCIDKTSSAELSEAINSMFRYYRESEICYVFLSDVHFDLNDGAAFASEFAQSRWFTRGWTLQELIAPVNVLFFNSEWIMLDTRARLRVSIQQITGIPDEVLTCPENVRSKSVAQRMSWAANRTTTRSEDIAYCLMGLFDVNMPLLYGEGEKAFIRLQEEIVKESDDHSLFAWECPSYKSVTAEDPFSSSVLGVFAHHPSAFAKAGAIEEVPGHFESMTETKRGFQLRLPILRLGKGRFAGVLNCVQSTLTSPLSLLEYHVAIPIQASPSGDGSFGRQPNRPLITIPEAELPSLDLEAVNLCKFPVTEKHDQTACSFRLEIRDRHRLGYFIQRAIYTAKPISNFTEYTEFNLSDGSLNEFEFPPLNRVDWVAAIRFDHAVSHISGFMVLIESTRARRYWSSTIIPCARDESSETILEQKVGTFTRNGAGHLELSNSRIEFDAAFDKDEIHRERINLTISFGHPLQESFNSDATEYELLGSSTWELG